MSIPFVCPHCQLRTEVANRFAGMSGNCVACGKPIKVPSDEPPAAKSPVQRDWSTTGTLLLATAILVAGGAIIAAFTFFAISPQVAPFSPGSSQARTCAKNMGLIADAISAYVADHGSYPPAYSVDATGKPLHSWRVLILPYLGYPQLYSQIDLTRPWDSPENAALAAQMPREYRCPADQDLNAVETSYLGICGTGHQCFFEQDHPRLKSELTDGAALTVMITEATGMGIHWMQPRDLDAAEFVGWNNSSYRGAGSMHPDLRFLVITADGKVWSLSPSASSEELRALVTIAGRETVYPELLSP